MMTQSLDRYDHDEEAGRILVPRFQIEWRGFVHNGKLCEAKTNPRDKSCLVKAIREICSDPLPSIHLTTHSTHRGKWGNVGKFDSEGEGVVGRYLTYGFAQI